MRHQKFQKQNTSREALQCLILGFVISWLVTFPFFEIISVGLHYLAVFFHELGHTAFFWFYGQPAVPSFNFDQGGGLATPLMDQSYLFFPLIYVGLGWVAHQAWHDQRWISWVSLLAIIFHVATAYTKYYMTVVLFMGCGAEILVAGYMIYRAALNLAPRGIVERYLNAVAGFYILVFNNMRFFYDLITNEFERADYRSVYGLHDAGDLSKIALNYTPSPHTQLQDVALFGLAFTVLVSILVFVLFIRGQKARPT
jgi:hypothetical protein